MRITHFASLISIVVLLSCGRSSKNTNDPISFAPTNDPELAKATEEALSKLDYFVESFQKHKRDTTYQYSLKSDFVENGEHEHMWISVTAIDSGQFLGTLANEPGIVKNIQYGDFVKLSKNQIEDWVIMNGDNMEGGYSVAVFQKREQENK